MKEPIANIFLKVGKLGHHVLTFPWTPYSTKKNKIISTDAEMHSTCSHVLKYENGSRNDSEATWGNMQQQRNVADSGRPADQSTS